MRSSLSTVGGVGRDVALGEDLGVARGVDRGDHCTALLERLRDARGAGEQVERGAGVGVLADARQHRERGAAWSRGT